MKITEIKNFIKILGYQPEEAKENTYFKNYKNYIIRIDFNTESIEYGNKIKLGDKTTSNFSNSENFVVLECVNRLLDMGYSPEKLTLEIKWDLGRKEKGKLDIYVADKEDDTKCFLMIECKTFGSEYEKEKKNMLSKGGQLFSYFQQDKSAQYLCLYASRLTNNKIEYVNSIVEIEEDFRLASNKNETYSLWNKMFKDNGIFEDWADIYDIKSKALIRSKLKPLQQSDSGFIFNRFAEILRHNIVSDKSNAFNKIFNLFLCKIEDEDKNPDEELSFQWKEDDNHISLQKRLNNLYKEGMRKFLSIEVTDFNEKDLDKELNTLSGVSKKHIEDMFTKLRLYKNNEFAFKEVFDDSSFEENATVLKEVVELLQPYQLRYTHKQQFLGDFFELLLNTGLKQESGQFFTPVPIAKFISSSIPLEEIIDNKIEKGEINFLPYVIDYAAGSGHFLTEAMDEIQHIIESKDHNKYKDSVKRKLKGFKEDTYAWAEEFIYGIEKDYRLVKTAKVACFLNGDGLANLIHADGLDNYKFSKDYVGKLKSDSEEKDICQFDVIVANPPYSVSAFKNTLKNGEKSFDLYNRLTDTSSEIECLFIERTKQLLKEGGYAGVVLPSSVLSNGGIYTNSREILLKYFEIIGIAELGSNTFMATGTNTVTLFLKRRDNSHWLRVQDSINEFFKTFKDITTNGIEKAYSKYIKNVYEKIDFNDYFYLLNAGIIGDSNKEVEEILEDYKKFFETTYTYKNLVQTKDYRNANKEDQLEFYQEALKVFIQEKEKEKLLYFMLSYNKQVILIKSGEKTIEKEFLGYEFSTRRGHEGIRMFTDSTGKPTTKLYDMDNLLNKEKVNSYIHRAFLGEIIKEQDIPESLENHVYSKMLHEMIGLEKVILDKNISLDPKKKVQIETKYDFIKLGELISLEIGKRPEGGVSNIKNGIPSLGGEHIGINGELNLEKIKYIPIDYYNTLNQGIIKMNDILLCKDGALTGKVAIVREDFEYKEAAINEHVFILRSSNEITQKYLFIFLYSNLGQNILKANSNGIVGGINKTNLLEIKIPLPPLKIQAEIVSNFESIRNSKNDFLLKIEEQKTTINNIIENISAPIKTLNRVMDIVRGASPRPIKDFITTDQEGVNWIKIGDVKEGDKYINNTKEKITKKGAEKSRLVKKGDFILSNSMSAGRPYIVNISGAIHDGWLLLNNYESNLNKDFLYYTLSSSYVQEQLSDKASGGVVKNLNIDRVKTIKIPLPTVNEQEKVVKEINLIEEKINLIEKKLEQLSIQETELLKNYL